MNKILKVQDLSVVFGHPTKRVEAVQSLSFEVGKGEILGIVGESACGKTVTCRAILGLNKGAKTEGSVFFDDQDLLKLDESGLCKIRGSRIAMVFQDPASSLNPVVKIGRQIVEVIRYHQNVSKIEAEDMAIKLLKDMEIESPEEKMVQYPFQQSGGVNQRIMTAIALSCDPDVLIADEPTSALDVTVQKRILQLFLKLREEKGIGIVFVTHDFGVIHEIADRIMVMYRGMMMEEGETKEVFETPLHPYTKLLLSSVPLYGKSLKIVPQKEARNLLDVNKREACPFAHRCPEIMGEECTTKNISVNGTAHKVRCYKYNEKNLP